MKSRERAMKKKILRKSEPRSCKTCVWVISILLLGGIIGYVSHYSIVNWHGFFVTCSDGLRPDKHGCCAGEVYTDAGNGWMVCCPEGADSCFPPMK